MSHDLYLSGGFTPEGFPGSFQAINETLRLYPPVVSVTRMAVKDFDAGNGRTIPDGAQLFVAVFPIHRDPKIYPDPLRFDPDRFSAESMAARHPYAFIPFGIGRRMCVGYKFAYMEAKTILSTAVRRYHMRQLEGGLEGLEKNLYCSFVLTVSQGIKLKFVPREQH